MGGERGEGKTERREIREVAAGREKWVQSHGLPQGEHSASLELIPVKFPN